MERRKLANHNSEGLWLLSEDIMTEIFLWLPVKSLIQFKRLSKRWYFLISHQDSYFRRNYLSNRFAGSNDDFHPIMLGFFYQKPEYRRVRGSYDRVRFLPSTSTQFKKYNIQEGQGQVPGTATTTTRRLGIEGIKIIVVGQGQGQGQEIQFSKKDKKDKKHSIDQEGETGGTTTTTTTTLGIENNNMNPFSSLDKSVDKFLSCCLHRDQDSAGVPKKIFIAASSNGFLLLSLESRFPETYYLVNPVTMEWATLPKPQTIKLCAHVGFVCKGNYPSLDTVEYTIVRVLWLNQGKLLFQFLSSGDSQWREYSCSCESLGQFTLSRKHNPVIVSTATNSDDQAGPGIVVYFLISIRPAMASTIVAFDLNKGDNSLQVIETPGLDLVDHFLECADYISEFDDGVIHYVRICCSTDFEFWDLNTESKEWCLKHRENLNTVIEAYPWMWNWPAAERRHNGTLVLYHIHAFHPMNPNLIFLTLLGRMVCYNVETGTLELVYDLCSQDMLDDYSHYVYQWPCWPPLL